MLGGRRRGGDTKEEKEKVPFHYERFFLFLNRCCLHACMMRKMTTKVTTTTMGFLAFSFSVFLLEVQRPLEGGGGS